MHAVHADISRSCCEQSHKSFVAVFEVSERNEAPIYVRARRRNRTIGAAPHSKGYERWHLARAHAHTRQLTGVLHVADLGYPYYPSL